MVLGNHEFYGGHFDVSLSAARREAQIHGVHLLEDESVVIGGVRFLGCTLWTSFDYFGADARSIAMHHYEIGLNDCRRIRASPIGHGRRCVPQYGSLTAHHVRARHVSSLAWLRGELAESLVPTVVVTHHLPRRESVAARYLHDPLTPGFASQLPDSLMHPAALWIHGHTHDSCDYEVPNAGPRIVCNPRGYPLRSGKLENDSFRDDFLVEVAGEWRGGAER